MTSPAGAPSRTRRALAWLAPSVVAAALAPTVAGLIDAATYADGALRIVVTAGFALALAGPLGLALAIAARAALASWQPRALIARLTDAGGAAPRLAGWMLGGTIGVFLFTRLRRKPFLIAADELTVPAAFLMGTGRIGNFIEGGEDPLPARIKVLLDIAAARTL